MQRWPLDGACHAMPCRRRARGLRRALSWLARRGWRVSRPNLAWSSTAEVSSQRPSACRLVEESGRQERAKSGRAEIHSKDRAIRVILLLGTLLGLRRMERGASTRSRWFVLSGSALADWISAMQALLRRFGLGSVYHRHRRTPTSRVVMTERWWGGGAFSIANASGTLPP